jgi:hypothetical protein
MISGLENEKFYGIKVQTVDKNGTKSAGVVKVVVIGSDTPDEVTDLAATVTGTRVRLSWTDPVDDDLDHIEISYNDDSGLIRTLPPVAKGAQAKLIDSLSYDAT